MYYWTDKGTLKRLANPATRRLITSMTLPVEQAKWLDYVAAQKNVSRSQLMSEMISEEMRRQERSINTEQKMELTAA